MLGKPRGRGLMEIMKPQDAEFQLPLTARNAALAFAV
jgi:hypothetical protein